MDVNVKHIVFVSWVICSIFWIFFGYVEMFLNIVWGLNMFRFYPQNFEYHRTCNKIGMIDWWIWRGLLDP